VTVRAPAAVWPKQRGSFGYGGLDRMRANRWFMLAVLFTARCAMGWQFQSIGASTPSLAPALHLDPAGIGALIGLYMLPGIAIAYPGALFGRWFGEKATCLFGLALMVAGGALIARSDSPFGLAAGRVISGSGAVVFNLVLTNMAVGWFAGREFVTALSVTLASWPLSIAVALIAQTALTLAYGWRVVMDSTAIMSGVAFVLVAALYRMPPAAPAVASLHSGGGGARLSPRQAATCGIAGLLWGAFNVGLVVFYSFTPSLLMEHGWLPIDAGSMTSLGLWISIASLPIGGWTADVTGRPTAWIILSCISAGLVMMLLAAMLWPWGLSLLLGLAIGPAAGAIVALPSRAVASANRSTGFGVFYTAYYVVMAVGPGVAGWGQKTSGSASAAVLIGGVLFLTGVPLLVLFNELCGVGSLRNSATRAKA
jgi:MFS family permease